jgi:flagellar biosynthesis protein FlhG
MPDQADHLRELAESASPLERDDALGPPMITVTGGKGGVGTTTVAVNLAAALADRGRRVVLVDAARHHADMAQVAGIAPITRDTLVEVLAGKCAAADALVPGPGGTLLLANRWAPKSRPDFSRHVQQRLLTELHALRDLADVVVVDTGSGLSPWTRRFWVGSRLVIVTTTTDDVAVMDTYAAIKLSTVDGTAADIRVLANQCECDRAAGAVSDRLANACRRFLGRTVPALPALPRHVADGFVGTGPEPRVWQWPNSPFGHAVLWLAHAVDNVIEAPDEGPTVRRDNRVVSKYHLLSRNMRKVLSAR